MRERAIASGADPLKIRVIPNGIALDEIGLGSAASSGREGTQPPDTNEACLRLLFVGTFNKRKGVDVLCRAARILKDDRIPFSLALVGVGPMQSSLERYVAENDLTGEIAFHGSVPRSQLGKWYQWANATCVPSLDEPLSTVVLESLIAGTPIVGSNVGGTPSMVQSGINGLLVEPNDASELAMALQQIARQPGYLAGLKRASAPSVAERFSWTNTGAQLFQAIEATINRASSEVRNRSAAIGPRA
jgi:glycosyltransferase involved in cell wall biosynthesis